ncbi:MAG: ferric reductase-like transmembrane domain-containing protein [Xanthomonadaceae bacterium]|nr:ferric reductase-like transmembrane domain-containing protein [Xanthomonadaceae bacterium]
MNLLLRAVGWSGLYVFLVLLPLLAALWSAPPGGRGFVHELGVAAGFVALAMLALEFALIARLRAVAQPFGIDALQGFHRGLGFAALGFALAHPLLLLADGMAARGFDPFAGPVALRPGAAAFWLLLALVATTLWRRRLRLSYEAWLALHRWAALLLLAGALWHVFLVEGRSGAPLMRALWSVYALLVVALVLQHRLGAMLRAWRRPWQVVENRPERGDARTLVVEPVGHRGFDFEPGQFAWLLTGRTPFSAQQHPITFAGSAEQGASRRLAFTIKALGDWSREVVPRLAPGARLWLDGPHGVFTPEREPAIGLLLIGGGVGITPMRAILLTMRDRGDRRPVLLLHAASSPERMTFREEFEALAREIALTYVPVAEDAPAGWTGERGRIDHALLARHLPPQRAHWQCFVCGPPPMLDAMERLLPACGFPAARVHTERFATV